VEKPSENEIILEELLCGVTLFEVFSSSPGAA